MFVLWGIFFSICLKSGKPSVLKCKGWKSVFFENQRMCWRKYCVLLLTSFLIQIQIRMPKIWNSDLLPPTSLIANILNYTKFPNKYVFWFELQHSVLGHPVEAHSRAVWELSTAALEPSLLPGLEKFAQTISDISPNITPKGSELSWKIDFRHRRFQPGPPGPQKTRNHDSQIYRTKHVNSTVGMMFTSPQ